MFMFHSAVALNLIALILGVSLYIWSLRNEGKGTCLAGFASLVVVIIAIISTACALYCGMECYKMKAWQPAMNVHNVQNN